jgi:hypothetical protein
MSAVRFFRYRREESDLHELADFDNESWQREVVNAYRDNFGWKKLFQLVPVAGMVFGALINRGALQDVSEAAKMLYRKRRVRSG